MDAAETKLSKLLSKVPGDLKLGLQSQFKKNVFKLILWYWSF